ELATVARWRVALRTSAGLLLFLIAPDSPERDAGERRDHQGFWHETGEEQPRCKPREESDERYDANGSCGFHVVIRFGYLRFGASRRPGTQACKKNAIRSEDEASGAPCPGALSKALTRGHSSSGCSSSRANSLACMARRLCSVVRRAMT